MLQIFPEQSLDHSRSVNQAGSFCGASYSLKIVEETREEKISRRFEREVTSGSDILE